MYPSRFHNDILVRINLVFNLNLVEGISQENLHAALTNAIIYLMLNHMEQLLAILYRIDVNEKLIKEAFAENNPTLIAPKIATLVINRELQKAISRAQYK